MKPATIERNFRKIKNQFSQTMEVVKHTKPGSLWEHEAAIRKKLKQLKELENENLRDFQPVYEDYISLFNDVSRVLLKNYNLQNSTNFIFEDVIEHNYSSYMKSGIISVLITEHIPDIISNEFDKVFPSNPKNEYKATRSLKRKFVLHLGETNTGKTYNAMEKLKMASNGIYLSPLRILALENYEKLNNEGIKCSLLTGEEEIIVEGANHISCTIEKLNINKYYDVAVIDEIQMIDDDQRGAAWTKAVLGIKCSEIHVCGSINSIKILKKILDDCADEYEIKEYRRNIPLKMDYKTFSYSNASEGDALVTFSKKNVLRLASYYSELGIKASIIYGDLPPEVRKKQYEQFINGTNKILITTDAIGMGVNLPIKRIIFMDIKKFDGNEIRYLNSGEVKQIAGRAGRKGIYDIGYVATFNNVQDFISENLKVNDREIEQAVVGPSDEILMVQELSLREKLALWSTKAEKVHFYKKMDITEYLMVLDSIRDYKLDERIQWKLLSVPFDISNKDLLDAFLNYIDEVFLTKRLYLSKPKCFLKSLYELETYYQKINLYYSFSRCFELDFDNNFVTEERLNVSESINNILRSI
ncbi:ATP-dependent RNA helicase SUPV3L1/SUV3 [Clostridium acidisoli DSM 12555]|uniref:RNA helicase n=1 Tax=Clostridium acidisoli DSM 12555 TaxID=1121291 RepID=A0A1W1XUK5_9CLOT|nr:helicase-related protein [Clostridium acidisoli]SMC27577.1 ATP-dependent RNA helicase SUPV3L1/SUV3 [Clostridium acidisoli DSM 12555]